MLTTVLSTAVSAAGKGPKARPIPKFATGATALYAQLASVLRGRITNGEWPSDSDIPSIDELCKHYGLGRITVRQSLQILAGEGLVSSQRGRRTFVTYSADNIQTAPLYPSLASVETVTPEFAIRVFSRARFEELPDSRWAIGKSDGPYMFIRKVDQTGDQPYAFSGIYIAEDIYKRFPKGAENHSKLLRLVVKYARAPVTVARERIRVAAADYEEADALGIAMATPVARVERAFCEGTGRVLYYGNTTYPGDRYGVERDLRVCLKGM